jgi:hypothetical protein
VRRFGLLAIWFACVVGAALIISRMASSIITNPGKAFDIAVALDRAGNAAANGANAETISSRANRARAEGRRWGCILCRFLDWIRANHCADSAGT